MMGDVDGFVFFFFFFQSIRLISLKLCGGLEPLTEPSLGAVDPRDGFVVVA